MRILLRDLAWSVWLVCSALGCTPQPSEITPSAYPSAGLYTPGNRLGASDPSDVPTPGMGLGNRCAPVAGAGPSAVSSGTLRVDYTTQTAKGRYAPKNCSAAWIETAAGQYVATLELRAGLRRAGLVYFQDHACIEKPGPDVMTSATLPDHVKPHSLMWSGADFGGSPVSDGTYNLFIEVTESDKEPGDLNMFAFAKGPMSASVEEPVALDGSLQQVRIAWAAMLTGSSAGVAGGH